MAMTASLAINPSSGNAGPGGNGSASTVTLTVNNTYTTTAVNVTGIRPYAVQHSGTAQTGGFALGAPVLNKANQSVATGGSSTFSWGFDPYGPQAKGLAGSEYLGANNATTIVWDLGCEVTCSDGTVLNPTVQAFTASESPHS